jgi:6-phosphofructokinase 1
MHGYSGLIAADFKRMGPRDVSSIIQRGGTILGSARCPEFRTEEGVELAVRRLRGAGIDGLVVIGGNGSQTGANALSKMGFPVVGVASTIDNDLYGSEVTIGVDTAVNVALNAIDNLKITASSHQRVLLVEVMGRKCGFLALMAGVAGSNCHPRSRSCSGATGRTHPRRVRAWKAARHRGRRRGCAI